MRFRIHCLAAAVGLLAATGFAATFTANGGAGSSTIGTLGGEDYASLLAAAADFSGAQAVTGNYTFYITSNLTESEPTPFGKDTAGFTVTLKPAAAATPTVTFTRVSDNSGPSGDLLIGTNNAQTANWGLVSTHNFVIDGSNTVGGTTRDLTLTNSTVVTHTFTRPICVVGDSDNTVVKNCRVINASTSTGSTQSGICFSSRAQTVSPAGTFHPDNWTVTNCEVRAPQNQGHGVNPAVSGTTTAGTAQVGFSITNNIIQGKIRPIFLSQGLDGTIADNKIELSGGATGSSGFNAGGVIINGINASTGGTLNILRNRIYCESANTSSGTFGPIAIQVGSAGTGNTVNVINNMIDFKMIHAASVSTNFQYAGILASTTTGCNYNILHNSIHMPNFTNLPSLTPDGGNGNGGIRLPAASATGPFVVKNNLIRTEQVGTACIARRSANAGTVTMDYNDVSADSAGGAYTGVSATGVWHTDLASWKTALAADSQEQNSIAVNPKTSTNSSWNSANYSPTSTAADLHFTTGAAPAEFIGSGIPRLASVLTDLDGNARSISTAVLVGADEIPGFPVPVNLSSFNID